MSRLYSTADIEDLDGDEAKAIVLRPGDLVTPAALDAAASRGIVVVRPGDPVPPSAAASASAPGGGADHAPCGCATGSGSCTCDAEAALETSIRSIVDAIAGAHPDADAETVAQLALAALGAPSGTGPRTARQAQPLDGRLLPTKALGARPVFFGDGGVTDALVAVASSLAAEVWTLRERLDTLEQLLVERGTLPAGAVDAHRPDDETARARDAAASAFVDRVFRVLEQMREEIVGGETPAGYTAVVGRSYEQLEGDR